jgi:DNA-binding NarL/FixJ family response regulator
VDDQRLFAEAIRFTLETMDMDVVGVEGTAEGAVEAVRRLQPDVVLLDIGLPEQSGIVVGERILEERPETKIIALTALDDPRVVKEALHTGFVGYVTKETEPERFERAIRSVMDGQVVVPMKIGKTLFRRQNHGRRSHEELLASQLTRRELEVLALLADGVSSRRIAETLRVSPNTVRTHVQNVLAKLQVHSRLEAAAFAVQRGLVRARH